MKRLYAVILIGAGLILFRDAAMLANGVESPKVQNAQARYAATATVLP